MASGGERDGVRAVSRRSLICVRSLLDVCFTTVETGCLSVLT